MNNSITSFNNFVKYKAGFYNTGTVSIVNGSTNITGNGVNWVLQAGALANTWKLRLLKDKKPRTITAIDATLSKITLTNTIILPDANNIEYELYKIPVKFDAELDEYPGYRVNYLNLGVWSEEKQQNYHMIQIDAACLKSRWNGLNMLDKLLQDIGLNVNSSTKECSIYKYNYDITPPGIRRPMTLKLENGKGYRDLSTDDISHYSIDLSLYFHPDKL